LRDKGYLEFVERGIYKKQNPIAWYTGATGIQVCKDNNYFFRNKFFQSFFEQNNEIL
jgi:hypothetical protein